MSDLRRRWQLPDSVDELLPNEARQAETTRRTVLNLFKTWGYQQVMPPLAEFLESLLTGTGHNMELKTFKLTDNMSGRQMGVRSDMTPQIARIASHQLRSKAPTRLCYVSEVLKTSASNIFVSRNPIQVGAELFGHSGIESDIEVLTLAVDTLLSVGFEQKGLVLDLAHIGVVEAVISACDLTKEQQDDMYDMYTRKAIPELDLYLKENVSDAQKAAWLRSMVDLHGDLSVLDTAMDTLKGTGAEAHIQYVKDLVANVQTQFPEMNWHIDLAELRGHKYHTGMVFSLFDSASSTEILKGGRYDNIGTAFDNACPATGFSFDMKALIRFMPAEQALERILVRNSQANGAKCAVAELRKEGKIIVDGLGMSDEALTELDVTAELIEENGNWVVKAR